jgi:hypothetical protein
VTQVTLTRNICEISQNSRHLAGASAMQSIALTVEAMARRLVDGREGGFQPETQ